MLDCILRPNEIGRRTTGSFRYFRKFYWKHCKYCKVWVIIEAYKKQSGHKIDAFEQFWWHVRTMHFADAQKTDIRARARDSFNINLEVELLREADDIIEELKMMRRIYEQQLSVGKDFSKHLQEIHDEQHPLPTTEYLLDDLVTKLASRSINHGSPNLPDFGNGTVSAVHGQRDGNSSAQNEPFQRPHLAIQENSNEYQNHSRHGVAEEEKDNTIAIDGVVSRTTVNRARSLNENIEMRLEDLQDLQNTTKDISDQLHNLLSLKQQQASWVAEASLMLSHESVSQGRSIMIFTVVTIIFLPLSFMSSLFGMNASELSGPDQAPLSLIHEFKYMFPISLGIIIPTLCLAFSARIRQPIVTPIVTLLDWLGKLLHLTSTNVTALLLYYSKIHFYWHYCIAHSNILRRIYKFCKDFKKNYGTKGLLEARKARNAKIKRLREQEGFAGEAKLEMWMDNIRKKEKKRKDRIKEMEMQKREMDKWSISPRNTNEEGV